MATYVEVESSKVGCTCTDGFHPQLFCIYKIKVEPSANKKQYILNVWCKLGNSWNMNWTGDSTLVVTCNGTTQRTDVVFPMHGTGNPQNWQGPIQFAFDSSKVDELDLDLDVDLTRTLGTNGGRGPTHLSGGGNFQHFYLNNYKIDVTPIPLIEKPVLGNIKNTNPYTNPSDNTVKNGVSKSTNSISLSWGLSDGDAPTRMWYRVDGGGWVEISTMYTCTVPNLTPGTSYKIEIQGSNDAGDSNILTITVRTRNAAPTVALRVTLVNLEQITFTWNSNKDLAKGFYSIDGAAFVEISGVSGKLGSFTAKWFDPNTSHTIRFYGISTAALDYLTSATVSATGTTLDRSSIKSITVNPFGLSIPFVFLCPSSYSLKLTIKVEGKNGREATFTYDNIQRSSGEMGYTWTPTQNELDRIYKCYTDTNSVGIKFTLTTHGEWKDWDWFSNNYSLILTGIAKTAHIGISNVQKRGQCWLGIDGVPKRAVAWIGINGVPKRGI